MTCPFDSPRREECTGKAECSDCSTIGHKSWCASQCQGCEDISCTCGALAVYRPPVPPRQLQRHVHLWTTRTTSSGNFEEAKRSGDVFRGSRRDDCGVWGNLDSLHKSLLFLLAMTTSGLVLHAFGVFCG